MTSRVAWVGGACLFVGLICGVLIAAWPPAGVTLRTEVDLVDILKLVVVAGFAYLLKRFIEHRDRLVSAQKQMLRECVSDVRTQLDSTHEAVRSALQDRTLSKSDRDRIVAGLVTVDAALRAMMDIVVASGAKCVDRITAAGDLYYDAASGEVFDRPESAKPLVEAAYYGLRNVLARQVLAIESIETEHVPT